MAFSAAVTARWMGGGKERVAEVGGQAAAFGFGEYGEGQGHGLQCVGEGHGTGVEGDDLARDPVPGMVGVAGLLGEGQVGKGQQDGQAPYPAAGGAGHVSLRV